MSKFIENKSLVGFTVLLFIIFITIGILSFSSESPSVSAHHTGPYNFIGEYSGNPGFLPPDGLYGEVVLLQKFLNDHGFIVAPSGPGSPGNETNTYDANTANAISRYQTANSIQDPAPGYFGMLTKNHINTSDQSCTSLPAQVSFDGNTYTTTGGPTWIGQTGSIMTADLDISSIGHLRSIQAQNMPVPRLEYMLNVFRGQPQSPGSGTGRITLTTDCDQKTYQIPWAVQNLSCTLTNLSGTIQPGERAQLSWSVPGGIVEAGITPTLPGFSFNDSRLFTNGQGQTGPLQSSTNFQLMISTSQGSGFCNASVEVASAQQGSVEHVATLVDIHRTSGGNQAILSTAYSGGVFGFVGMCGGNAGVTNTQSGSWFYQDDGTLIASRDLCIDAGAQYQGIFFHGSAQSSITADDDRGFVAYARSHGGSCSGPGCNTGVGQALTGPGAAKPIYYQVVGGTPKRINASSIPQPSYSPEAEMFSHVRAATNGVAQFQSLLAQVPGFNVLMQGSPSFTPLTGFEGYIVGYVSSFPNKPKIEVYRPSGNSLQFVEELSIPANLFSIGVAIDHTTTPKRIAVAASATQGSTIERLFIYSPGANGIQLVEERTLPQPVVLPQLATSGHGLKSTGFAIGGEYFAYPKGTGFVLLRGNEQVAEVSAPLKRVYQDRPRTPGPTYYIHMSSQGTIMVGGSQESNLYRITGFVPPSTQPPFPGLPPGLPGFPTFQPIIPDINFFLDMARSLSDSFMSIFGRPPAGQQTQQQTAYTGNCPPRTAAEIQQFQCQHGIVCSGTPETTGYGNLGPLTRAKIAEIYPSQVINACQQGLVQGASIDIDSPETVSLIKRALDGITETARMIQEKVLGLGR